MSSEKDLISENQLELNTIITNSIANLETVVIKSEIFRKLCKSEHSMTEEDIQIKFQDILKSTMSIFLQIINQENKMGYDIELGDMDKMREVYETTFLGFYRINVICHYLEIALLNYRLILIDGAPERDIIGKNTLSTLLRIRENMIKFMDMDDKKLKQKYTEC